MLVSNVSALRTKLQSRISRILVGLLCLTLLVFVTAELAHGHANAADASHCQLCAVSHLATSVVPTALAPVALLLVGTVYPGEPSPGARAVLVTAFIRPPPVLL